MIKPTSYDGANMATLDRLAEVLDRHGAERSKWPAQDRREMEQLISRSTHARALLRAAEKLDEVLDTARPPEPSAALVARIMGAHTPRRCSTRRPSYRRSNWLFQAGPVHAAAASAVAAAVITIIVTTYLQPETPPLLLALEPETSVTEITLDAPIEPTAPDGVDANTEDVDEDQIELTEVSMATLDVEQTDYLSQLSLD